MNSSFNNYSLLIFLGAVWGASFVAIKFSNLMFNPIEIGFFRTFIGATVLLLAVLYRAGSLQFFQKKLRIKNSIQMKFQNILKNILT